MIYHSILSNAHFLRNGWMHEGHSERYTDGLFDQHLPYIHTYITYITYIQEYRERERARATKTDRQAHTHTDRDTVRDTQRERQKHIPP